MSSDAFFDRPDTTEYAPFYAGYVARVPAGHLITLLEDEGRATAALLAGVSEERAGYRYAPEKWSIKEMVGHLCDAERIFSYRALRFGRGDGTPLASFDENLYVPAGRFDERTLQDLAAELAALRTVSVALFRHFSAEDLARRGTASGHSVSVRALGAILLGHELHHRALLAERYGISRS